MLQCLNPCQLHHYFVDFENMKYAICMSWFTFLHLEKMEYVLFCSFGNRSESFLFEWSTFLFLVQKHWYVKFLRWVGWWGEGWVGWTAKRTTSRTCFLYISDKKGTFHFHFSDKIHIKRNFLKKGTKWQSLVNSQATLWKPSEEKTSFLSSQLELHKRPCYSVFH